LAVRGTNNPELIKKPCGAVYDNNIHLLERLQEPAEPELSPEDDTTMAV
jgi:hypothetical protein